LNFLFRPLHETSQLCNGRSMRLATAALILWFATVPGQSASVALSDSTSKLSFSYNNGVIPAPQTMNLTFANGSASWTAASDSPWLSVSPTSGSGSATLQVSVATSTLAATSYTGHITINAPAATPASKVVTVSLTVFSPNLAFNAKEANVAISPAGSASATFNLSNTGGSSLNWTASSLSSWLQVSPTSGSAPAQLTLTANLSGYAPGTYRGNVQVKSPGASGSPATLALIATVSANGSSTPTLQLTQSNLNFSMTSGGATPAAQVVGLSDSPNTSASWTAQADQSWIALPVTAGTVPSQMSVSVSPTGLNAGTYTGHVKITVAGLAGSPASIPVSFVIQSAATPTLQLTSSSLTFAMTSGGTNPNAQSLGVSAMPNTSTAWNGQGDRPWITLPVASGMLPTQVSVSVNPIGMSPGTYSGHVQITAAGLTGSPSAIPVTLVINQAAVTPTLKLTQTSLSYSMTLGGATPIAQVVGLSDVPATSATWLATADQTWIVLPVTAGTLPWQASVSVNPSGLGAGTYNGHVQVMVAGLTGSPVSIPVTLVITAAAAPVLQSSPTSVSFSMTSGGANPSPQAINVNDTPNTSVGWTAQGDQPWITLPATKGTLPAQVSVSVNPSGLNAGTYSGHVQVAAAGLTGSPLSVPVTFTISPATATGTNFYVSPTGSSKASGAIADPWDLATALNQPAAVKPGATIWMRGGIYHGSFTSKLAGTATSPITVRQYPGERATIDSGTSGALGALTVLGSNTRYWGFEVMSSNPNRYYGQPGSLNPPDRADGVAVYNGPGNVFINMIVHDTSQGFGWWTSALSGEVYGCLIYYNGWNAPDRGHGHGIYVQNEAPNLKLIQDNIQFYGFGMGFHAYGSGQAHVQNIHQDGNVSYNSGYLAGGPSNHWSNYLVTGGAGSSGIVFTNNHSFHNINDGTGTAQLGWEFSGTEFDLLAQNNYFIGGEEAVQVWNWNALTFTGNTVYDKSTLLSIFNHLGSQSPSKYTYDDNAYYGVGVLRYDGGNVPWSSWTRTSGVDAHSTYTAGQPTGPWTFVRPNQYEPGRANIVIYNWGMESYVSVDVSPVLQVGQQYAVQDAMNFFGPPVASGVYNGSPIAIPMTGLALAPPIGSNIPHQPVHTAPEFGAFVLLGK
jgi:hypothetical protein